MDPGHEPWFEHNHGTRFTSADLADVSQWWKVLSASADTWLASPPCPPWSRLGYGSHWADERAWPLALLPCLAALGQPAFVLIEQVQEFVAARGGQVAHQWATLWQQAGYVLVPTSLSSQDFTPMRRQ